MSEAKKDLLIVDDEAMTRTLMAEIFVSLSYTVRTAEDGFAALKEIHEREPDLILSDLNMPRMTGFELLSVVRRRFPRIRVVAMSGALSDHGVQPGVAADAFYEKASRLPKLLELIESLSKPEPGVALAPRNVAPIWIPTIEPVKPGESCVMLACPECLRVSSQVLWEEGYSIRQTRCTACDATIEYAILRPTGGAPQPFQARGLERDSKAEGARGWVVGDARRRSFGGLRMSILSRS